MVYRTTWQHLSALLGQLFTNDNQIYVVRGQGEVQHGQW